MIQPDDIRVFPISGPGPFMPGSGKSTLLRLLYRLNDPQQGQARDGYLW
jgi:ABC-type proline/glycine betaine transport system ATPase subunit